MVADNIVIGLGKRIAKLRKKLNISQIELAQRAGVSKTYLGELERGKRTNISVHIIANIAAVLDISMSCLFSNVEESMDNDDLIFAQTQYEKIVEDVCYPPGLEGFSVTTLLQFLVYLPLIKPEHIIENISRIAGCFEKNEEYVLKQINQCISMIPPSYAKEYADDCANRLCKEVRKQNVYLEPDIMGLDNMCYREYLAEIKHIKNFYEAYRAMMKVQI